MIHRACLTLLMLCWVSTGLAGEAPSLQFPSPDGRFALQIAEEQEGENTHKVARLIEKSSGPTLVELGAVYPVHLSDTVLVWSADSKRAAYATRDNRDGATSVYFWNGEDFEGAPLPEKLPEPHLHLGRKAAAGGVKMYGGGTKPLRWLKSGELELSSDSTLLSRVDDKTYTGMVRFTIAFDAKHLASVKKIGKSQTVIDE